MLWRVVHKSTAGMLSSIPEAVGLVGNSPWGCALASSAAVERGARTSMWRRRWCQAEIQRGVTVIIFMQADHFADQWPGDENQLALPFNLAVAADPAQCEVAGVDRICEPGRIGSR